MTQQHLFGYPFHFVLFVHSGIKWHKDFMEIEHGFQVSFAQIPENKTNGWHLNIGVFWNKRLRLHRPNI